MRTMRTGTRVHSHRTGAPASELRYVAAVPATSDIARARSALARKLRDGLEQRGYLEVETPIAVPFAGQEPHLRPFETTFTPDPPIAPTGVEGARRLHLHTSPEYAMKRLLARPGFSRCYQLVRVFRDGELSRTHNPEFTLLELYAAPGSAHTIMADLEQLLSGCATEVPARRGHGRGSGTISLRPPFERLTCREAFSRYAGFDPIALDAGAFTQAARACGVRPAPGASWDDLFTQVLLEKIEPSGVAGGAGAAQAFRSARRRAVRAVRRGPRAGERVFGAVRFARAARAAARGAGAAPAARARRLSPRREVPLRARRHRRGGRGCRRVRPAADAADGRGDDRGRASLSRGR